MTKRKYNAILKECEKCGFEVKETDTMDRIIVNGYACVLLKSCSVSENMSLIYEEVYVVQGNPYFH